MQKGLQGVKCAGAVRTLDEDPVAFHPQKIPFRRITVSLHEIDAATLRECFSELQRLPSHRFEALGEELGGTGEFFRTVHPDGCIGRNPERTIQHLEMRGQRNDLRRDRFPHLLGTREDRQSDQYGCKTSHGLNVLVTVFPSGFPARVKPRALITASLSTWNGTPS